MKPECSTPALQEISAVTGEKLMPRPLQSCRDEAACSGPCTPHQKRSLAGTLKHESASNSVEHPGGEESQEVGYDEAERPHGPLQDIVMTFHDNLPAPKRRRLRGKQQPHCPHIWKSLPKMVSDNQSPRSHRARRCQQMSSALRSAKESPTRRICIAVSGFELDLEHRQFLERIGIRVVDKWSQEITHLIANSFKRTLKMMCSVCAGTRIYTFAFLEACWAAGQIVADDSRFALRDVRGEMAFASRHGLPSFSLQGAIAKVLLRGPLLAGYAVYCSPDVKERNDLQVVVEAAGGLWLHRHPAAHPMVVEFPTLQLGQSGSALAGAEVYDKELLIQAACTQELLFSAFKLAAL